MKLNKISNDLAKKIIVEGEDKAFTIFNFKGNDYTIYHRIYENKYYDILELTILIDNTEISAYYLLDHEEVKQLIGGVE